MQENRTIFALSSGHGVSGVAVVRISGPGALSALSKLGGPAVLRPRHAHLVSLQHPVSGCLLDKALVIAFPGPASFTGEDVAELHLHGGRAVVSGVLDALADMEGLYPAEAGEFTRRAFEAGKLDLTEAEGLGDLLHARTAAQRDQALRQMDGGLRAIYEDWRARLIGHLAHLEADIDFPDEDLPEGVSASVAPALLELEGEIRSHLDDGQRGERLRDGFRIVILGAPNVGKSTLMNHLARSDVAIVSDEAGTTRDSIEVELDLGGYPVRLIDTAGIREAEGAVEAEGIRRSMARAGEADLRLVLAAAPDGEPDQGTFDLLEPGSMLVFTKGDLAERPDIPGADHDLAGVHTLSVMTGEGVEAFLEALTKTVRASMDVREAPALTRVRHRKALEEALDHLGRFQGNAGIDPVLAAEDVRMATRAMGSVTGRVDVEDLLDVIFSDFCIGK